jgi:hypothetical protein
MLTRDGMIVQQRQVSRNFFTKRNLAKLFRGVFFTRRLDVSDLSRTSVVVAGYSILSATSGASREVTSLCVV